MPTKLIATFLALAIGSPHAIAEDLLDTAARSGSFRTFLEAVRAAGLTRQLKTEGPYTVFMPTDTAFAHIDEDEWNAVKKDPQKLARVIRYHMVGGKVKVTEVKPGPTRTDEGQPLTLKSDNGMVTVNGARVTDSDLVADNGIIHGIDGLLLPPEK